MAPSPTERLLASLLKADAQSTSALTSFLASSHASHAALSAYASANPPPVGDVLREIEAALRGVQEAVRAYVGAMEAWAGEMGEVREREEELGAVVRDRDILVTRLIKATKLRPTSSLIPASLLPSSPHSSALSLPSPTDAPKLVQAQAELQACEQHLTQRQRALEELTRAAIARGVLRRSKAMEELGDACRVAGGRARTALGALVPAQYLNGSTNPLDKPLPNPSPYAYRPFRPASPGTDGSSSLSPSQSASQIATYAGPHQHRHSFHHPTPSPLQQQQQDHQRRVSLHVPPAHSIPDNIGYIPTSDLLPGREHPLPAPPPTRRPRGEDSDSDDPAEVIAFENPPRASLSFPSSPRPSPPTRRASHPAPVPLPTTHSDLGPQQIPAVQSGGARPRPNAGTLRARRRPSSRSLDSYPLHLALPSSSPAQQKRRGGFFGSIARALHIGGSSVGGSDRGGGGGSPMYSPAIGAGAGGGIWGSSRKAGGGAEGGWRTRTDRVLARQRGGGRRGEESSDEDGGRGAVVMNAGLPPTLGSGSVRHRQEERTRRLSKPSAPAVVSPREALERRLDASTAGTAEARRSRTMSTPGRVGVEGLPSVSGSGGGGTPSRMRTISESSGARKSALIKPPPTPTPTSAPHAAAKSTKSGAGVTRSATVKSTATVPTGTGGGLSRGGTMKSTMSAPPGPAKKKTSAASSSIATVGTGTRPAGAGRHQLQQHQHQLHQQHQQQQQQGRSRDAVGGPSILSVLEEPAQAPPNGLFEIKAPPRVVRDPADTLVSVTAPPPTSQTQPQANGVPHPLPAPAPTSLSPTSSTRSALPRSSLSASSSSGPSSSHSHSRAVQGQDGPSHAPVPSASAPPPGRSAMRPREPSPSKRGAVGLGRPPLLSPMPEEDSRPASVVPPPSPRPPPSAPPVVQPTKRTPSAAVTNAAAAGWRESLSDDTSTYETGLEDLGDGEDTSVEGTPVMRASMLPDDLDLTPTPAAVPPAMTLPPPARKVVGGSEISGTTESTMVGDEVTKVVRRKSVRLDVPPSLTNTPADMPSASPWSDSPAPPPHSPPQQEHDSTLLADAGWSTRMPIERAGGGGGDDDSSDEDEEYARVKRELASVNRRWAKAGKAKA